MGVFPLNSIFRRYFYSLKSGFQSLATLKLVVNVGELKWQQTGALLRAV